MYDSLPFNVVWIASSSFKTYNFNLWYTSYNMFQESLEIFKEMVFLKKSHVLFFLLSNPLFENFLAS
jgi:hypothetical protein